MGKEFFFQKAQSRINFQATPVRKKSLSFVEKFAPRLCGPGARIKTAGAEE